VSGGSERSAQAGESGSLVQAHRGVHPCQRFQVAPPIAEFAGGVEAPIEQGTSRTASTRFGQQVHLAQFAGARVAARQRGNATPAHDVALEFEDEIDAAGLRIGASEVLDFRVGQRETGTAGAELRHDAADDRRHCLVVVGADLAQGGVQGRHVRQVQSIAVSANVRRSAAR
jgi:hypothetical protein